MSELYTSMEFTIEVEFDYDTDQFEFYLKQKGKTIRTFVFDKDDPMLSADVQGKLIADWAEEHNIPPRNAVYLSFAFFVAYIRIINEYLDKEEKKQMAQLQEAAEAIVLSVFHADESVN